MVQYAMLTHEELIEEGINPTIISASFIKTFRFRNVKRIKKIIMILLQLKIMLVMVDLEVMLYYII